MPRDQGRESRKGGPSHHKPDPAAVLTFTRLIGFADKPIDLLPPVGLPVNPLVGGSNPSRGANKLTPCDFGRNVIRLDINVHAASVVHTLDLDAEFIGRRFRMG